MVDWLESGLLSSRHGSMLLMTWLIDCSIVCACVQCWVKYISTVCPASIFRYCIMHSCIVLYRNSSPSVPVCGALFDYYCLTSCSEYSERLYTAVIYVECNILLYIVESNLTSHDVVFLYCYVTACRYIISRITSTITVVVSKIQYENIQYFDAVGWVF